MTVSVSAIPSRSEPAAPGWVWSSSPARRVSCSSARGWSVSAHARRSRALTVAGRARGDAGARCVPCAGYADIGITGTMPTTAFMPTRWPGVACSAIAGDVVGINAASSVGARLALSSSERRASCWIRRGCGCVGRWRCLRRGSPLSCGRWAIGACRSSFQLQLMAHASRWLEERGPSSRAG